MGLVLHTKDTSSGHMLGAQLWKNVAFNVFTQDSIDERCFLTVTEMPHIYTHTHVCTHIHCYFYNSRLSWLRVVKHDQVKRNFFFY